MGHSAGSVYLFSVFIVAVVMMGWTAMGSVSNDNEANVSRHLGIVGRVNLGSFYTPARYVERVASWLKEVGVDSSWTIADLSCGYGAFFEMSEVAGLEGCEYIGNDIDLDAVVKGRSLFPKVKWLTLNALVDISRIRFGIGETKKLAIVGNPPYNDVTSQINQNIKTNQVSIDADIRTRDLGMSSLLAYDKLKADYVAVLHPLSYLIKKSNFSACRRFFGNYRLVRHVVFSSQEFAGTSKTSCFPVIVGLYERHEDSGLSYENVCNTEFQTVEGDVFSVNGFEYVTDQIAKYPHAKRYDPEILFYTLRDVNALKRCRTFIVERIPNAVDVNPAQLSYYCYIDCFKRFGDIPYWMGNFNVPYVGRLFADYEESIVRVAKGHHPEVFPFACSASGEDIVRVKEYISKVMAVAKKGKSHGRSSKSCE